MKAARFRSAVAARCCMVSACTLLLTLSSCSDDPSLGPPAVVPADGGLIVDAAPESAADAATFDTGMDPAVPVDGAAAEASPDGGPPADGSDGSPATPCVAAGIDAANDPFAGVYSGVQLGVVWTYVLNAGAATVTGETDTCSGSYTVTGSTTGTLTLVCKPLTAAGSPEHTDTGSVTLSNGGATMTYAYSYGTGSDTTSVTRVCP